jgi:hypothetical protein
VIKDKYFPHISLTTWLQSRLSAPKLGKTSWILYLWPCIG